MVSVEGTVAAELCAQFEPTPVDTILKPPDQMQAADATQRRLEEAERQLELERRGKLEAERRLEEMERKLEEWRLAVGQTAMGEQQQQQQQPLHSSELAGSPELTLLKVQVYVMHSGQTITLGVDASTRIEVIKAKVEEHGVSTEQAWLTFACRRLERGTLQEHRIPHGGMLFLHGPDTNDRSMATSDSEASMISCPTFCPALPPEMETVELPTFFETLGHSNVELKGNEACQAAEAWRLWKKGAYGDASLEDAVIEYARTHSELQSAFTRSSALADELFPGWKEKLTNDEVGNTDCEKDVVQPLPLQVQGSIALLRQPHSVNALQLPDYLESLGHANIILKECEACRQAAEAWQIWRADSTKPGKEGISLHEFVIDYAMKNEMLMLAFFIYHEDADKLYPNWKEHFGFVSQQKPTDPGPCDSSTEGTIPCSGSSTRASAATNSSSSSSSHSSSNSSNIAPDPFNLRRFSKHQAVCFNKALEEIRSGQRATSWMWFTVPTPPFFKDGIERGSPKNKHFSLKSEAEARAYLNFEADGVKLRSNYLSILHAIRDQLSIGVTVVNLLGARDAPKLASSVKLFERIARAIGDRDLHRACREILALLGSDTGATGIRTHSPDTGVRRRHAMATDKTPSSLNATRAVSALVTQTRGSRQAGSMVEAAGSYTGHVNPGGTRARPNSPGPGARVGSPRPDSRAGSPSPAARRPVSPRREVAATAVSQRVTCVVPGARAASPGPVAAVDSPKLGHRALPVQQFGAHGSSLQGKSPRNSQTSRFAGPSGAIPTLKSPRPSPLATTFASTPGLPAATVTVACEAGSMHSARRATLKTAGSSNRAASCHIEPPMSRDRRQGERGPCAVMRQLSSGQRRCDMLRTSVR